MQACDRMNQKRGGVVAAAKKEAPIIRIERFVLRSKEEKDIPAMTDLI